MDEICCEVCKTKKGIYICPKCNLLYCSADCYRAKEHLDCSEIFFKKCVEEELQLGDSKPGKSNIFNILLRSCIGLQDDSDVTDLDDDSDDGSENDDLSTRLENVDLHNESAIWDKLNPKEKNEFKKLISSGNIRKILPDWQPWWKFYKSKKLVSEVGLENEESNEDQFIYPNIDLEVPAFNELTTKTPATNIPFMFANLLMSYAYTARWFKGKHYDMPVEALTMLFALSSTIKNNKTFNSLIEAYMDFENDVKNCKWLKNDIDLEIICEDVVDFVKGQRGNDTCFSVKACLCNINNITKHALIMIENDQLLQPSRFTGSAPSKVQMKLLSKKIIYYFSWIGTYGEQLKCLLP